MRDYEKEGFVVRFFHITQPPKLSNVKEGYNKIFKLATIRPDIAKLILLNKRRGSTVCEIQDKFGEVVSAGIAVCKLEDQFNRSEGRRRSFNRALDKLASSDSNRDAYTYSVVSTLEV